MTTTNGARFVNLTIATTETYYSANNEKNETREDIGEISVTAKSSSNSMKSTTSGSILCGKSGTFKYFPKIKTCPEGWVKK